MVKIFIIYYSLYGHIYNLAQEIKKGVEDANVGANVELYQVSETLPEDVLNKMHAPPKFDVPIITPDKLAEADGIILGIPTRFGMVPAQMKAFLDSTGQLWVNGKLNGKFGALFFSTGSQHGGQETTALTALTWFAHLGINYVPLGYRSPHLQDNTEIVGGSPYGSGTVTGGDGMRPTSQKEKEIAHLQGEVFAKTVATYVAGKKE